MSFSSISGIPFDGGLAVAGLIFLSLCALVWRRRAVQTVPPFRADIEHSELGYIRVDSDGLVVGWNLAAEKLFGFPPTEAMSRALTSLIVPDDRIDEERELRRAASKGELASRDAAWRHRDGTLVHVSVSAALIQGQGSRPAEIAYVFRDLSQRRRLERELASFNQRLQEEVAARTAELEASQHYLRGILDAVPVTIAYWNCDLRNEFANESHHRRLGVAPGAMRGRTMLELIGKDFLDDAQPYITAALRGEAQFVERTMQDITGAGLRQLLMHYLPDVVDGEVQGFYVVGQDITDIVESRMQLLAERQRVDYILRGTDVGTWEWHAQTGEVRINERWASMLGYTRSELEPITKASWLALTHPDDCAQTIDLMKRHFSGELDYFEYECRLQHRDGSWRWVAYRGSVSTHLPDGSPEWVCGTQMDITRRREAEAAQQRAVQAAEAASAAKGAFLANMSHEIRTPLNAVLGMSYLLGKTALDTEQRAYLEKLQLGGNALLALINDVLDLSKIEAGDLTLDVAPFAPAVVLRELCELMRPQAESKGLDLKIAVAPQVPAELFADGTRVRQILFNLLVNAIKFTERGCVTTSVEAEPLDASRWLLRFTIRDTGIGIKAEDQARLFHPFAQADISTTRRFGGTGLGLSIVQRLVDLMGGEVGVVSAPGEGSEFWVKLPLSALPLQPASVATADTALPLPDDREQLAGLRVLVVDDNPVNLEVMSSILRRNGAETMQRSDGREAVEYLREHGAQIDVVLMDVQMPVMDGCEATRRIRAELGLTELPVLAVTAGALVTERTRALEAGMNDFLTKPLPPARLIEVLQRYRKPG